MSYPSYKKIPNSKYLVDYFKSYDPDIDYYFLSHFHSDHYYGLKKSFKGQIICSTTSKNLILKNYKMDENQIFGLENDIIYNIEDGCNVICIDAHHCPGAVCFIFYIKGLFYLHTGDFRASADFYKNRFLEHFIVNRSDETEIRRKGSVEMVTCKFNVVDNEDIFRDKSKNIFTTIFLDNTFKGREVFPSQKEAVLSVVDFICSKFNRSTVIPVRYAILVCGYLIGKEKIYLSLAEVFNMKICVTAKKKSLLSCFSSAVLDVISDDVSDIVEYCNKNIKKRLNEDTLSKMKRNTSIDYFIKMKKSLIEASDVNCESSKGKNPFSRISPDGDFNSIHVISTYDVSKDKLNKILQDIKCDRSLVIIGTGWSRKSYDLDLIRGPRVIKKGIEVRYFKYSEHSSSTEIDEFLCRFRCKDVVYTVR